MIVSCSNLTSRLVPWTRRTVQPYCPLASLSLASSTASPPPPRKGLGTGRSNYGPQRFFSSQQQEKVPSITLYQYYICPFCNAAKAVMDYAKTDYNAVEVNPLSKAEIKWSKDYKKVPIMTIDEKTYNGSDDIIQAIVNSSSSSSSFPPTSSSSNRDWDAFAKDELAPLLYPNLCATLSDSWNAFGYVHGPQGKEFSLIQKASIQSLGSVAMYFAASKIKKRKNIEDVQAALSDALDVLETEGLKHRDGSDEEKNSQFLSESNEPSIADLRIFGTLRGLEGLPVHEKVLDKAKRPALVSWYLNMEQVVGPRQQ